MGGIFFINDPRTLLAKLRYDLARMEREPWHPFPAFDFFVTAYHVLDWIEPGQSASSRAARQALEDEQPLLAIAGHLATFAKHYRADAKKWDDVSLTYSNHLMTVRWPSGQVSGSGPLMVAVTPDHVPLFDGRKHVPALEIARALLAWWEPRVMKADAAGLDG